MLCNFEYRVNTIILGVIDYTMIDCRVIY
jgi:hypothetical protein